MQQIREMPETKVEDEELQARKAEIKSKNFKNRLMKFVLPALGATVLLIGGFVWWQHASAIVSTDDAFITGHVHQLGPKLNGTVVEIAVNDNQHVMAGQTIIKIDPRDNQLAAASSRAAAEKAKMKARETEISVFYNAKSAAANSFIAAYAISNAKASVSRAEAALSEAQSGIIMAQAQVQQREAELIKAQSDYDRYQELIDDRAVTMQTFEQAREARAVGQANFISARANLAQARTRVLQAQQSLMQAKASVAQAHGAEETAKASKIQTESAKADAAVQRAAAQEAEVDYQNALTQLSYTNIVAPISGRIGHRTVEIGQQVERGQALLSIVSDEKWVVANFKETELKDVRPGELVDIKIDSFPGKVFRGKVDSISPASGSQFTLLPPDNASGNFTKVVQRIAVKIVFDPESIKGYENLLAPGMSVEPAIHVRG